MAVNGTGVLSALLPIFGLIILLVALVVRHPRVVRRRWSVEGMPDQKQLRA
jgi:hypothetical protein